MMPKRAAKEALKRYRLSVGQVTVWRLWRRCRSLAGVGISSQGDRTLAPAGLKEYSGHAIMFGMGWTVETVVAVEAEIKALTVKLSARLVRLLETVENRLLCHPEGIISREAFT